MLQNARKRWGFSSVIHFTFTFKTTKDEKMENRMVTTATELPGYVIVENLGVVRGLVVRSRSIVGSFLGGIQTIFGGNITIYTTLCEQTRSEAFELMCLHARERRADGIIAMRYDATEVMAGLTEVLCYGTAVKLAKK
jgi:uncharacterized protein YbjQ (UPF0145 family)